MAADEMAIRSVERLAWLLLEPVQALCRAIAALFSFLHGTAHVLLKSYTVPGPRGLPLVGVALDVERSTAGVFSYSVNLWKRYGRVFGLYLGWRLYLCICDRRDYEVVLSGQKFLSKGFLYKFLHPWLGTGLLTSTGEKWRARRKILTPAFHFKILEQFLPVMLNNTDIFVQQLRQRAGGAAFDVFPPCSLLTLDVICETAMGVKVNAQTDSKSRYVTAVKELAAAFVQRVFQPWLHPNFLFWLSPFGRRYRAALDVLHGTTKRVIQERKVELQKLQALQKLEQPGMEFNMDILGRRRRLAFLDLLLLSAGDGSGTGLTDSDVCEEVDTFMFEGHDTTSSGLAFTLFLLSQHPDIQEKVVEELESLCDPTKPLQPTLQNLSDMKYLEMVIKETLRLYPPVPIIMREITDDTNISSRGVVMPAGSTVMMPMYALHRDPEVFPDPEIFDPERFRPEKNAGRHPFAYLPFSAGPRNCIGMRFAMLEMKSAVAKTLWNFRLLPVHGFEPILVYEMIIKSQNGLFLQLEERRREVKAEVLEEAADSPALTIP